MLVNRLRSVGMVVPTPRGLTLLGNGITPDSCTGFQKIKGSSYKLHLFKFFFTTNWGPVFPKLIHGWIYLKISLEILNS